MGPEWVPGEAGGVPGEAGGKNVKHEDIRWALVVDWRDGISTSTVRWESALLYVSPRSAGLCARMSKWCGGKCGGDWGKGIILFRLTRDGHLERERSCARAC